MDPRVREVIELMNADLSRVVRIDGVAPTLGLSPSRLWHVFKSETGASPGRYLKTLRVRRAQEFLETTHLRVQEIMVQVGLNDESHFVRDFETICGCTPARYRARYREEGPKEQ